MQSAELQNTNYKMQINFKFVIWKVFFMTTKEFLSQAYRIDQRINSKLEQIKNLRELATKATSTISETGVCDSGNKQRMESIIVKIVGLEREINCDIDTLVDLKKDIMALIKNVENPEYQTLLELRYLCFKRWEQIAIDMGYDLRYIYKLHLRALSMCKKT